MTEEKKSMVPKLRFPEFTETWEQHKLGDLGHTYGGLSGKSKQDFGHGDARFVTYMNVFSNPIGDPCMVDSIEIDDRQSRVRKGDVLFTTSSETPDEVGMSCVWPSDSENLYLNSFCFGYRPTTKINSNFLASLLRSPSVREKIIFLAQGISRYNISKNKVMEISIPLPSEEEQSQIGDFFTQLDKTITLHQRKLDVLNKLKKYLLQKMFPENGQLIPELRFPAFSGAWEQRKLSEIVRMNARIGWQNLRQSEFLDDGDFLLITGTDFKNGRVNFGTCHYIAKERFDQDPKIQVEEGSILLTKDGTIGKVALVDKLSKPATLNAGVYNIVPKNRVVESRFLFQYLSAPFLLDYVNKAATGGTIKHLNQSILVDFPVSFPSVAEQEKIGKFLEGIDHVTTLHQRKLEGLRKLKKSLLQQMFV